MARNKTPKPVAAVEDAAPILKPARIEESVIVGKTYNEKNGVRQVIPYFVDYATAVVQFADIGKSNEARMRTDEFLWRFELSREATPA